MDLLSRSEGLAEDTLFLDPAYRLCTITRGVGVALARPRVRSPWKLPLDRVFGTGLASWKTAENGAFFTHISTGRRAIAGNRWGSQDPP